MRATLLTEIDDVDAEILREVLAVDRASQSASTTAQLFQRMRCIAKEHDGDVVDADTRNAIADVVGIEETRPHMVAWLRTHVRRMDEFLDSCKTCAPAAIKHWDEQTQQDSLLNTAVSIELVQTVREDLSLANQLVD